jgi:UDP-N-acetylmuramoyl-tripeptide--D-alanyl-D-alanine ligase
LENLTLKQIAKAVNGTLKGDPNLIIGGISTNSKEAAEDILFVPIKGERFDAHDFIGDFVQNGGQAVLTHKAFKCCNEPENYIKVTDTRLALGDLARNYREQFALPLVGVTGSVGKTSTRLMLANVLQTAGEVCSTQGNFNNDIGMPLTLLNIEHNHKFAVIEMGMNHFGEIAYLAKTAKPTAAVITNIGTAHIGNLGSKEGILKAKLEVLEGLQNGGLLVLNGDDDLLFAQKGTLPFKTVFYGINNPDCDITATQVIPQPMQSSFKYFCKATGVTSDVITINAPGKHHISNALAAVAVGLELGLTEDKIKAGIESFVPGNMRQKIIQTGGVQIIEDCYNANPDSMLAALQVLAAAKAENGGRKIAVLGNMMELGEFTEEGHRLVGDFAVQHKVDLLVTVGEHASLIAAQANSKDVKTVTFGNNQAALEYLAATLHSGDVVLVKASRSSKFEEISAGLQKHLTN